MKAFDTDVLTEILAGNPVYAERLSTVPTAEQSVTIVTVEELIRGRLHVIRQAEAGKARVALERAYSLFEKTLADVAELRVLSVTQSVDDLVREWRKQKIRGSTHDLRIGACCVVHNAKLITRNRRDFESMPGLAVEIWE